jgi:hypothetical protein
MSNTIFDRCQEMMEEELERIHPTCPDFDHPDSTATATGRDLERLDQFAREFDDELQGKDSKKIMFIMDIAIHVGETPSQLRRLIDDKGIEPVYKMRMSIHLAAKDMGVSYREAGDIFSDLMFDEKGARRSIAEIISYAGELKPGARRR